MVAALVFARWELERGEELLFCACVVPAKPFGVAKDRMRAGDDWRRIIERDELIMRSARFGDRAAESERADALNARREIGRLDREDLLGGREHRFEIARRSIEAKLRAHLRCLMRAARVKDARP